MAKKKANGTNGKTPRQDNLAGMEDTAIKELEEAALDYADGRDERMAATEKEVELKTRLIGIMHKHDKKVYKRGKFSIKLTIEKEKVQVRIKDQDVSVEVKDEKKSEATA